MWEMNIKIKKQKLTKNFWLTRQEKENKLHGFDVCKSNKLLELQNKLLMLSIFKIAENV